MLSSIYIHKSIKEAELIQALVNFALVCFHENDPKYFADKPSKTSVPAFFFFFTNCIHLANSNDPVNYGIPGCGVFNGGIQSQKGFWLKINCSQMKLLNFENWTNGEPQQLAKIRVFKVGYLIFHVKNLKNQCELDVRVIACNFQVFGKNFFSRFFPLKFVYF